MKKKILFVIDSLNSGGAEKSLVTLLNLFNCDKYDIDLLTFKKGGLYEELVPKEVNRLDEVSIFKDMEIPLKELLKKKEIKKVLWRINTSYLLRYKSKFTNIKHGNQRIWPRLNKVIGNHKKAYDVAIAYSQGVPTYYVAEKVKANKKLCWVNIDYKFAGYNRDFDYKYYKNFDKIVGVSNTCTSVFKEVFPEFKDKLVTIYDIISENLVKEMSIMDKGFKDKYKGIRILTIGRLVYQKGYEFAVEAAKYLKDNNIEFRWYAIGEGILREKLEDMIKEYKLEENFILLGTFTNPYPFINECDIYCQPSRFEGFGLAIAEARILKKPVVATNFDIVYEQIRDNENGLIAKMDGIDLGKKIYSLILDKEIYKNIIEVLKSEKVGTEIELQKVVNIIES